MPTIKIKDNDIWKVVGAPSYADIEVDETLTQAGQAADAKAVGDALANAGSITIDLEGADDGEANLVNADTLGGKTPEEFALASELTQIRESIGEESVSAQIDNAIDELRQEILGGAW